MMWLKTNPDGTPSVEGATNPYCYHIDQFSQLQPVIHRVVEYCGQMGLDMIQGDHEDAPGQLELNFTFDRAERTADHLTTYRQVCRQVGREFNLFPVLHAQAVHGGLGQRVPPQHVAVAGRDNMFLPEGDDPRIPSKTGLHAIGGVLTHLRALTAITAPTVNSYRRFADAGFWAPIFADWGFQNRTTALRVSAPGPIRVSLGRLIRQPLPVHGGFLGAMRDGLEQTMDPGPPEEGNIYEAIAAGKQWSGSPPRSARRSTRWRRTRWYGPPLPGDMYRVSCTTSATSGSGSSAP